MEIPRYWRTQRERYCLVGEVCPHCELKIFPPRYVCPACGGLTQVNTTQQPAQRPTQRLTQQPAQRPTQRLTQQPAEINIARQNTSEIDGSSLTELPAVMMVVVLGS